MAAGFPGDGGRYSIQAYPVFRGPASGTGLFFREAVQQKIFPEEHLIFGGFLYLGPKHPFLPASPVRPSSRGGVLGLDPLASRCPSRIGPPVFPLHGRHFHPWNLSCALANDGPIWDGFNSRRIRIGFSRPIALGEKMGSDTAIPGSSGWMGSPGNSVGVNY